MSRSMNKFKLTTLIVLVVLLLVFCLQNTMIVTVKFLIFEMSISRALLVLLVYAFGIGTGMLLFRKIWK